MEQDDCYTRLVTFIKEKPIETKPTMELVHEFLDIFLMYFDEQFHNISYKDSNENPITNYILSLSENNKHFVLYAILKYIFEASDTWQNLSLMDLANPSPKRNALLLKILLRVLLTSYTSCIQSAQEIYDSIYATFEENLKTIQTLNNLKEEKANRDKFMEMFEGTYERLLEDLNKKKVEAEIIANIDEIEEIKQLEKQLQDQLLQTKQAEEKIKLLETQEEELSCATVDNEKYEADSETLIAIEMKLKTLNDAENSCYEQLESKIQMNQKLRDMLKIVLELKESQGENEMAIKLYTEAKMSAAKESNSIKTWKKNINDLITQEQEVRKKLQVLDKEMINAEEDFSSKQKILQQEINKITENFIDSTNKFAVSEKKTRQIKKKIKNITEQLQKDENNLTESEIKLKHWEKKFDIARTNAILKIANK